MQGGCLGIHWLEQDGAQTRTAHRGIETVVALWVHACVQLEALHRVGCDGNRVGLSRR